MDLRWSLLGLVAFALFVKITRSKDRPASPNNKNNMDLSKPQVGASSSSSSSPSSTHSFTHDVFLSFRGLDTRNNFTSHLHSNLVNKGIRTYIDNDLTRGEDITKELLEAIEGSMISIVVFSANYASSKWCLDELVKIFQCKESKQQIVYPIFYKVEPWEMRYQKGQVGEAIARISKHKDNLEKMESWKKALQQAADLSGWPISDGSHEANIIGEIVEVISTHITKSTLLDVAKYPVGIESRVEDIRKQYLNAGQDNPHMVGIWGIGGIGKSTLAKAVYNSISHEFEHSCFLESVREKSSSPGGLLKLQNNVLSKIANGKTSEVKNVAEGVTLLKQKLSQKRVLLVIDDVDCLNQLEALAGECDWFGPKSRIIITTRDMNCLVNSNSIYEVKELNHQEASELFNLRAFNRNICQEDFSELATEVIRYAKGIPLVLEVLGSNLRSKNKAMWKDALEYYLRYPDEQIQQAFQRSYDGLPDRIKEVFLHIACFFKGDKESYVMDVLQSCDLLPFSLEVLVGKALIKIEKDNSIWMHDLLEDMGKEIVRQESRDEIGERSRLWHYEDVREVLEENKGTDKIKAIVLKSVWNSPKIQLNGGNFTNLKNLQIFKVHGYEMLSGESVDYLPNQLRVLDWIGCSLRSLPTNFNPRKLGMLQMSGPCTTPLGLKLKEMRHLKSIKLWPCDGLTRIPDLSGLTSLKYLVLSSCSDLVEVDPSVGRLDKLVYLDLSGCEKLRMFPKVISLKSLETLDLSDCPLELFPEIEGDMKSLKYLNLSRTAIEELPCSVGNLTGLKYLDLSWCYKLTNVPSSIFYEMHCLEDLDLGSCSNLVTFPTKSESLPPPVFSTNLTRLQVHLTECCQLKEISEFPREIDSLHLSGCWSLERISKLSKILEGKDSKMFGQLDLASCVLCDDLACQLVSGVDVDKRLFHLANKRTGGLREEAEEELMEEAEEELMEEAEEELMEEAEEEWMEEAEEELMEEAEEEWMEEEGAEAEAVKLTALLTLFFSCAKSDEFQVTFPASAPLPNWITCRQDVNGEVIHEGHEFCIEIPQNSNWDNKGLALCISQSSYFDVLTHFVYINGIKFDEKKIWGDTTWVHYIPFVTVKKRLTESGISSPDMFRVMFCLIKDFIETEMPFEASWGVHLIEDLEGEDR